MTAALPTECDTGAPSGLARFEVVTAALLIARLTLAAMLPLGDDEGYYWVWSRHPALGYYDHPPLVAWLVALSVQVLGVSLFALRLPFVLLGTATACLLRSVVGDVTGDHRLARRAALLVQIVPVHFGLGLLVSPDSPLLFFWLLVVLAAWRVWGQAAEVTPVHRWRDAWMIGTALGGALTSKYVAILLPVSLAAWCVATGRSRALPALLGASALAILLFAPVVWWNAHHDWASLRYQFASRHREASFQADRFAPYLGSQALYLSPLLFGLLAAAGLRVGPWAALRREPGASFLWWMGAPTLAAFAFAGAVTSFKPNWPAPGYLTMLPLALRGVDRRMQRAPRAARRLERSASAVALASVVLVTAHALRPFVPLPHGADPTQDMRGWPVAAAWPSGPRPTCPLMSRSRRVWSSTLHAPERLASVRAHRTFHIVRAAAGPGTTHILTIGEA